MNVRWLKYPAYLLGGQWLSRSKREICSKWYWIKKHFKYTVSWSLVYLLTFVFTFGSFCCRCGRSVFHFFLLFLIFLSRYRQTTVQENNLCIQQGDERRQFLCLSKGKTKIEKNICFDDTLYFKTSNWPASPTKYKSQGAEIPLILSPWRVVFDASRVETLKPSMYFLMTRPGV